MTLTCRSCRAVLVANARYCGACGTATRQHGKQVAERQRTERRLSLRAALALGAVCVLPLFGLLGGAMWVADGVTDWTWSWLGGGVVLVAAVLAGWIGGSLATSAPLAVRWPWLVAAVPTAALTLAVSVAYTSLFAAGDDAVAGEAGAALWFGAVVLAPLGEEWLCRGVAWRAAERLAGPGTTVVLTAIVFAFLHGLGGYLLALPHRFVSGLAFGWLRGRSGSLLPGVIAHALHNAAAVYWFGG